MIQIRKSSERGFADHGWLKAKHSFSFADYHDPAHMGFSVLRVINEDRIEGGEGFPTHGHRDMEIITYIISGELAHKDSMGNIETIQPGEVQRMSAGSGVRHSEFNHLKDQQTHLLQIWILPQEKGIPPSYEQKSFKEELARGNLILVASGDGREGSVSLNQDIALYAAKSDQNGSAALTASGKRSFWVQVVSGNVEVNQSSLTSGDGAAITGEKDLKMEWTKGSEFLVFDLPTD